MASGGIPRLSPPGIIWCAAIASGLVIAMLAGIVQLTWLTLSIIVLCATCELVDSSLGMGYGTTLTPLLLLLGIEPLKLVPTILVSELISGFAAAFFHSEVGNVNLRRGSLHLRSALILSACSVVGAFAGVQLAVGISKQLLTILISVVILCAGIYILIRSGRPAPYRDSRIIALGIVASFNKALSGGGYGPLMTSGQVIGGVEGRAAVGITSLAEAFTCLAAASFFLIQGNTLELSLLAPVLAGALVTVPFSAQIVRRIPEQSFKHVIAWLTIALGLFALLRTVLK